MTHFHRPPDAETLMEFLPTFEGGKERSVRSGYRPLHLVAGGLLTSGHHEYIDKVSVAPGESAKAQIWFLSPEHDPDCIWEGRVIRVQKGSRLVGHSTIMKVFDALLAKI
jgi:elongation factor Tu